MEKTDFFLFPSGIICQIQCLLSLNLISSGNFEK